MAGLVWWSSNATAQSVPRLEITAGRDYTSIRYIRILRWRVGQCIGAGQRSITWMRRWLKVTEPRLGAGNNTGTHQRVKPPPRSSGTNRSCTTDNRSRRSLYRLACVSGSSPAVRRPAVRLGCLSIVSPSTRRGGSPTSSNAIENVTHIILSALPHGDNGGSDNRRLPARAMISPIPS
jgi:hypothetical protein